MSSRLTQCLAVLYLLAAAAGCGHKHSIKHTTEYARIHKHAYRPEVLHTISFPPLDPVLTVPCFPRRLLGQDTGGVCQLSLAQLPPPPLYLPPSACMWNIRA